MTRAMVPATLAVLLVAVALSPRPVRADTVVGAGRANSCAGAALDAALAAGGNITFSCGASPVTITVPYAETISVDTSIDGGTRTTLSGGPIANGGTLAVTNSAFAGNRWLRQPLGGKA